MGWACERQPLTVVTVMCSRCHSRKGGSDAGQRAHPLADQHGGPCPLPGRAPGRPTPPGTAGAGPAARSARTEVGGARKRRAGLRQGSRCRAQRTPRHAVGLTPAERKLAAWLRAGAASTGPLTEAAGSRPGGRAGAGRGCRRRPFGPGPCAAPRKTRSSANQVGRSRRVSVPKTLLLMSELAAAASCLSAWGRRCLPRPGCPRSRKHIGTGEETLEFIIVHPRGLPLGQGRGMALCTPCPGH